MKKHKLIQLALLATLASTSLMANATANTTHTIYGSNFGTGSSYATTLLNNINATFTATTNTGTGLFGTKSQAGYTGAGVQGGPSGNEIDIGQYINASFSNAIIITNFTLGVLFNGPEYKDVNEKAQVTATYLDNSVHTFTFTATGNTTAIWTGLGSYSNLSPAIVGDGGVWSISNPFGKERVKSLSFTAIPGLAGAGCTNCNNQSDYTLVSVSAVPEPKTSAMMLLGLMGLGFMVRRNKKS